MTLILNWWTKINSAIDGDNGKQKRILVFLIKPILNALNVHRVKDLMQVNQLLIGKKNNLILFIYSFPFNRFYKIVIVYFLIRKFYTFLIKNEFMIIF